ncbi:hypothetical protein CVT25_013126 [Psilocybe cyanescens]|uniref:Uncharacterized protein n=1 Tax=Psilocybe cyanescens TaxID=93625 RepID=A0A409XWQ7_PSICY|nr:hypothetical protein CVT25_013126 [Psilocybe cyanescens]
MPHLLQHIASSFTRNPETNQLETPIFDTPLTDQTIEDLETLQREILTQYNKAIDQKETAKQNYHPAAARLAHHQARSQRLKLNLVKRKLYQRLPLIAKTMATVLLDKLQSWGLEREIEDVLWKHHRESSTVRKLSIFPLTSFHLQNAVPSRPLPARPPAYCQAVRFSPVIDNLPSPQILPPASTPSRSPIPTPTPRQSPKTTTLNPDTFAQNALSSNASTAINTHLDTPFETAATTQKTSNTLTPIMEELTKIFSTTPESPTPQANHTETIELTEEMDFTPSEA